MRDTGFRPGEVAALAIDNYYPELHGIYSQNSVAYKTRTIQKTIKTSHNGKDYKVGILTEQTERVLNRRIDECKAQGEAHLFLIDGRFINPDTSNKHFVYYCPVSTDGRTQYCLRHSFETDLAGKVENKVVAELMAHTAFNPTYDHRTPETLLKELQPVRELLEKRH